MARSDRRPRAPFVLTVALAALPAACGGSADDSAGTTGGTAGASGSSGGTGPGTGGSGGTGPGTGGTDPGTGGTGANPPYPTGGTGPGTGGTAGTGGTGGTDPNCPPTFPNPFESCSVEVLQQTVCHYELECQSGPIGFDVRCVGDSTYATWQVDETPCAELYDSCGGTQLYCQNNGWGMPLGTNPPSPCPDHRPVGEECSTSPMGGVRTLCGYRCAGPNTPWTVGTCTADEVPDGGYSNTGHWIWDDACGPNG